MPFWERAVILAVVVLVAVVLAKLVDRLIARRQLDAASETRYRVLRRSIMGAIIFFVVLSGLMVIPQVRAIAGALLASSALLGIIIGFASQRTLGNFVAGLLIAFTQPLRIGDRIQVDGTEGVVEEIKLTYTTIRADDDTRLVVPNDKLASDTIRNSTIVDRAQRAEITVKVPLNADLENVIKLLREECSGDREVEVYVSDLDEKAILTVRALAADPAQAEMLEHKLRFRAQACLRAAGVFA
jgi:small-conductance mechanosensitive channel